MIRWTADDQRRAGLIDEDGVHLVDDREVVATLDEFLRAPGHVVTEVVEPELVVGAVGDIAGVLGPADRRRHLRMDHPDGEAEETMDPAHVLGVALGEVVVDGDDVHTLTGQRVEVGRQGRDQRLALTGLHLGDVAKMKGRAPHDLHIEMPLAQRAPRCLAHGGKGLGQQVVEGLPPVREPLAELVGHASQFTVGQAGEVILDQVHLLGDRLELAQDPALAGTQDLV